MKFDRPNLLIVGFAKCGTTSLAKYLSDHPSVCPPEVKESYEFVDDGSSLAQMNRFLHEKDILENTKSESRCVGYEKARYYFDATPYHFNQEKAKLYAQEHDDTKVIFLVRSPENRLRSSYLFFKNVHQEYPDVSFEKFIGALLSDAAAKQHICDEINKPFYQEVFRDELLTGQYVEHIDSWVAKIGRERVFVGKMEDMRDAPQSFMADVCKFLDITCDPYKNYEFKAYQKTFNVRFPLFQRSLRAAVKFDAMRVDQLSEYHNGIHLIKNPVLRALANRIYKLLQNSERVDSVQLSALNSLKQHYASYNDRLEKRYDISFN